MNTHKSIVNTLSKRGYLTLLALLIAITSFAQEITVNGTVLDETDTPLIGATIQIKNTQKGVITDFDGKFSIKANNNATLVVSYIGYQNQEIKLKGQKEPEPQTYSGQCYAGRSGSRRLWQHEKERLNRLCFFRGSQIYRRF